ncbi:ArsR/SmtB family transcription factor [Paenibacillus dauci]|uniref:ArsR/SmtB family transcription factor n=1 Tax=Paenibacillus dauci TaxID=1567106 RepID=UPI000619D9C8|nr:metalloregulator ArsR/SmtB family transcription factor [Paenibacillus dauci]
MELMATIADDLKLLGDKTRLTMLALLQQREWCVCEFVEIFNMSQPSISQHMRKLKTAHLVKEDRRGQWVYYSLNIKDKPHIQAVLSSLPAPADIVRKMGREESIVVCDPETSSCAL